ncbi:EF-hand domain-containing protein [Novipirellula caenicola]|uniref:EF-hand domain-containing protein n=1 Tax=Novipirellula caenicola TaxID=1536901 RepID=A0ABP9VHB0_9BACT
MSTTRNIAAVFCISLASAAGLSAPALGQGPDRGRGGGDRGDRGDRGGGDRGDRGGGDRGGGDRGRGGPPGGGRGGFDPASMLQRLDTNGNGVLDPDEQQGPAQFIISRVQQSDSSVVPGRPVPLDKITKAFERMREEREGGGGDRDRDRDRGSSRNSSEEAWTAELLVPGFGVEIDPVPLLGFGAASEMMSVAISDKDKQEAAERMREYDRNRDGYLSKEELARGRFGGDPLDFDRNRDGRLSADELAVRYARRREVSEVNEAERRREESRRRDQDRKKTVEDVDYYNGRKSYRIVSTGSLPEGTPGFFADKDANGDGQVEMAEFASEWSDEKVAEFFRSDLNGDGIITLEEARQAVEMGTHTSTQTASTSSSSSSGSASASSSTSSASVSGAKPDEKLIKYAERIISRYDKNKDQALTASEWSTMLMSPAAADGNRDGRVTVIEYASWMQSRSK